MGIKLICFFFISSSCVFAGCAGPGETPRSEFDVRKEDFVNSYKTGFICGCINELTNDSLKKFMVATDDLGLFSDAEVISYHTLKEADSLGRIFSSRIKPVNYEDAGNRKPIFSGCMHLGLSREVDSLAAEKYRIMNASRD